MTETSSSYPITNRIEKISDTELRLKGFDTFIWYWAYKGLFLYLIFTIVILIASPSGTSFFMKEVESDKMERFIADPTSNNHLTLDDFVVKTKKINWEVVGAWVLFSIGWYLMFFKECVYSFNKTLKLIDDTIVISWRKYKKSSLAFISITVGLASKYGRPGSYRVNLKMKGWFFTNKVVIPIVKKEEATEAAHALAKFFNVQVWDETNRDN